MLSKNIAQMKLLTEQHIAADALVKGHYWEKSDNEFGGTGCFIGCLTHSSDAAAVTKKFGLPEPSVKIAESIFEDLPDDQGLEFFRSVPVAIGSDGKDLSKIHWLFLADLLRHLPQQTGKVKEAIDRVVAVMDLLSLGNDWTDAADAADAARAAYAAAYADARADARADAARAAADAARAAAYADARAAARAAYVAARAADVDVERRRQRDVFLRLLREAA